MKPGAPLLKSTRLLDQVSERIRYRHYSLRTKKAYLYWVRFFIRWSATQPGRMRNRWGTRWAKAAFEALFLFLECDSIKPDELEKVLTGC